MIACLRSVRFMPGDRSRSLFVELRRFHDLDAKCDNKSFVVAQHCPRDRLLIKKSFGTFAEAGRYWDEVVRRLEDQGLLKSEMQFVGFHEEG